jgi:hypothetical protein
MSAVVGGALLAMSDLWAIINALGDGTQPVSEAATTAPYAYINGMALLGVVLMLFGLVGLHLRQVGTTGVLGLVGFSTAFVGTALMVGFSWYSFFVVPSAAVEAPEFVDAVQVAGPLIAGAILSFVVLVVGWALFGVGALVARSYPRWVAIVVIVVALLQFIPVNGPALRFGVAVALLGFFALTGAGRTVERPSHMS